MFFSKKPKTTEDLLKKCEKSYNTFIGYTHLAHYRSYHEFKEQYKIDCGYLMKEMFSAKDDELKRKLIEHFQEQLDFLNDNCFSADKEKMEKFLNKHYPYVEKVEQIKLEHEQSKKSKIKP